MRIPNRYVMYTLYIDGDVTEAEYNTYLIEQEERERNTSEKFQETVNKINIKE